MTGFSKEEKEPEMAQFVATAPLGQWLTNQSFEHFYERLRQNCFCMSRTP